MSDPVLRLQHIAKTYKQGKEEIAVLNGFDLDLYPGKMIALVGPSGSGKSTLLHIAGLLERPSHGEVYIDGENMTRRRVGIQSRCRREKIGFIYQFHHLLSAFTAQENIALPQMMDKASRATAMAHARDLLSLVGLGPRAKHRPAELSGGEQQRVAIMRALANSPKIILADEPTGNLDVQTADKVWGQLLEMVKAKNVAALVATHNMELAKRADEIYKLENGMIEKIA